MTTDKITIPAEIAAAHGFGTEITLAELATILGVEAPATTEPEAAPAATYKINTLLMGQLVAQAVAADAQTAQAAFDAALIAAEPGAFVAVYCDGQSVTAAQKDGRAGQPHQGKAPRLVVVEGASAPAAANEFTAREQARQAMHTGVDRLLATLSLSRRDFGGMSDADILYTLADTFAKTASPAASLTTLKLAATARDLETVTDESVEEFFAAHDARIVAERTVSPAAAALAASWQ